ncbi:MAG TPA: hypothetical protein DCL41_01665 [Bdellovibrionales bacterium]|nr:hypothetical protein [Bdellovibrionales bacterium]|tara:strand:- start:893 stop:1387 length:495 start_codon:yes stop_codon:yes gene_type:complete
MDEIKIREAKPVDAKAIHIAHMKSIREICAKDHGEEEIKGWGFREFNKKHRLEAIERDPIWVVECNKAIEGYAHLRLFEKEGEKRAHILALYLTRVIVGRGIGTNLTNLMLEGAKRYRAKAISLESTLTAHAFYSRFGFKDSSALMKMEINGYPVSYFPMAMDL